VHRRSSRRPPASASTHDLAIPGDQQTCRRAQASVRRTYQPG
jgi:hypothetical protein